MSAGVLMASYMRPGRIEGVLEALAAGPRVLLAGGTDHYAVRAVFEPDEDVVDLTALSGMRAIGLEGGYWRIPALATWMDVRRAGLPGLFEGVRQAATQVGGEQVQNAGTLVGNVCNASPAADGVPALLALDAEVELRSLAGVRRVSLEAFIEGPRRTGRRGDEMVTALLVPDRVGGSVFHKVGGAAVFGYFDHDGGGGVGVGWGGSGCVGGGCGGGLRAEGGSVAGVGGGVGGGGAAGGCGAGGAFGGVAADR